MSLLTSTVYRELESVLGPQERTTSYTLTHTGAGWTLLMRYGTEARAGWATPLAGHGAGADAAPRVAQAVGVRVLHELGVEVTGWQQAPGTHDEPNPDFVADTMTVTRRALGGLRGH